MNSLSKQLTELSTLTKSTTTPIDPQPSLLTTTTDSGSETVCKTNLRQSNIDMRKSDQVDMLENYVNASSEVKLTHTSTQMFDELVSNETSPEDETTVPVVNGFDCSTKFNSVDHPPKCLNSGKGNVIKEVKQKLKSLYVQLPLPWASKESLKSYIKMLTNAKIVKCYQLRGGYKPSFRVCLEPEAFDKILERPLFPTQTFIRPYSSSKPV